MSTRRPFPMVFRSLAATTIPSAFRSTATVELTRWEPGNAEHRVCEFDQLNGRRRMMEVEAGHWFTNDVADIRGRYDRAQPEAGSVDRPDRGRTRLLRTDPSSECALSPGHGLGVDLDGRQVVGDDEANRLLSAQGGEYRAPFVVPDRV